MTEAVHVAGAIRGGASLVHGVQMRNVADKAVDVDAGDVADALSAARRLPARRPAGVQHDVLKRAAAGLPPFDEDAQRSDLCPLTPTGIDVLQINVGKLCNQTCRHCHVDAGPTAAR